MIAVDTSVWIDFFNGRNARHVRRLHETLGTEAILIGDLILWEILQGLESERSAREVEGYLRSFDIVRMVSDAVAAKAPRISVTLKADIRPGVTGAIESKVASVERHLAAGS